MFSLFAHPIIGIQCTEGILRIAVLIRRRWKDSMYKICEEELPVKLALPSGEIRQPKECGEIIRTRLQNCTFRYGKKAVLLLPSTRVYTHLSTLPSVDGQHIEALLRADLERTLPENIAELTIQSHLLSTASTGTLAAAACLQREILQSYLAMAQEAGLHVTRATTPAAAVASFTTALREVSTFLLLALPTAKDARTSATLFHRGWPVDEAVVPASLTQENAIANVLSFMAEYERRGMAPERIVLWGDTGAEQRVREGAERSGRSSPLPTFESALPWLAERHVEWGAIQAACLAPASRLSINFLLLSSPNAGN